MTNGIGKTRRGYSATRFGVASLTFAGLAFVSWALIPLGFVMVYVAAGLAVLAGLSGVLGVGLGIRHAELGGTVAAALGLALTGLGVSLVVSAVMHF